MQDNNFTSHTFLVDMWMLYHMYIQAISDVFSDLLCVLDNVVI